MDPEYRDDLPNSRARHLLRVLVERYIVDGHPVGSRTLSRDSRLDLSPATIRNVMSDLEELGLISAPHTSAGRVPTDLGYRLFVDVLIKLHPIAKTDVRLLQKEISSHADDGKELATKASNMLSGITQLAGVVTLPRQTHAEFRQVEFISLSENKVLAVVVVNDAEVQNRILYLDRKYTSDELRRAANYLNQQFAGKEVDDVRRQLLEELQQTRQDMNQLMIDAITLAQHVFKEEIQEEPGYIIAGETNLMEFAELSNVEKLRALFEAFNRQRDILHLLDQCLTADGVQIFIGHESGYDILDECSIVSAPYTDENENIVGVVGVIGPTRMAYQRVIPVVDITAKLLGAALKTRD